MSRVVGRTRMGLHTPGQVEAAVTNAIYAERMRAKDLMISLEADAMNHRKRAREESVSTKDGQRFLLIAGTIEWAALKVGDLTLDPKEEEQG